MGVAQFLMIKWILQKIVGSKNMREIRRIRPTVVRINEVEQTLQREPEEKLREMTAKWQAHLARYHELQAPAKPVIERMSAETPASYRDWNPPGCEAGVPRGGTRS